MGRKRRAGRGLARLPMLLIIRLCGLMSVVMMVVLVGLVFCRWELLMVVVVVTVLMPHL